MLWEQGTAAVECAIEISEHARRIASGLGGMLNVVASMVRVGVNLVNGLLCREAFGATTSRNLLRVALLAVAGVWLVGIVPAIAAMTVGTRSLGRRDLRTGRGEDDWSTLALPAERTRSAKAP